VIDGVNLQLSIAQNFAGGVGFETSSAKGKTGAVLVANSTLSDLNWVSVFLIGNWNARASRMTNR
jgi:hypothetical protein